MLRPILKFKMMLKIVILSIKVHVSLFFTALRTINILFLSKHLYKNKNLSLGNCDGTSRTLPLIQSTMLHPQCLTCKPNHELDTQTEPHEHAARRRGRSQHNVTINDITPLFIISDHHGNSAPRARWIHLIFVAFKHRVRHPRLTFRVCLRCDINSFDTAADLYYTLFINCVLTY